MRAVQIVQHVAPEVHDRLARDLPGVRRIQVIHVEDGSALELIADYAGRADAFLLDSGRPSQAELAEALGIDETELRRRQSKAANSTLIAANEIVPTPGRRISSTPPKPTMTAIHRRHPTLSPSIGTDKAVVISGAVNPSVSASISGIRDSP